MLVLPFCQCSTISRLASTLPLDFQHRRRTEATLYKGLVATLLPYVDHTDWALALLQPRPALLMEMLMHIVETVDSVRAPCIDRLLQCACTLTYGDASTCRCVAQHYHHDQATMLQHTCYKHSLMRLSLHAACTSKCSFSSSFHGT